MTKAVDDQRILETARRICTPNELYALELYHRGFGYRTIGRILGISRDAARGRIERAMVKIRQELTA